MHFGDLKCDGVDITSEAYFRNHIFVEGWRSEICAFLN